MARSIVAVVKTTAESVLADIDRLAGMAGIEQALPADRSTILKDNISWHMPFLGANTTPWQLEGVILALKKRGYRDLVCVENRTVVTNARKGERLNRYTDVLARHAVPVKFNSIKAPEAIFTAAVLLRYGLSMRSVPWLTNVAPL